jgi:holin-like protein
MIRAITILLLCQLIGTVIQEATGLPVPGPVLGLVLLLVVLLKTGGPSAELRDTSMTMLRYLGLLFVPAGVGVVNQLQLLGDNLLAIIVAVTISTLAALTVTAFIMQWFLRRAEAQKHA